jgi:hypothetical protein
MAATGVPYIDPNVEHVGVSRLRRLNAGNLRSIDKALVIQDKDIPLAVLLSYDQFLTLQKRLQSVLETMEVLMDEEECSLLVAGLADMKAGRTRPLSAIRAALNKRGEPAARRLG